MAEKVERCHFSEDSRKNIRQVLKFWKVTLKNLKSDRLSRGFKTIQYGRITERYKWKKRESLKIKHKNKIKNKLIW